MLTSWMCIFPEGARLCKIGIFILDSMFFCSTMLFAFLYIFTKVRSFECFSDRIITAVNVYVAGKVGKKSSASTCSPKATESPTTSKKNEDEGRKDESTASGKVVPKPTTSKKNEDKGRKDESMGSRKVVPKKVKKVKTSKVGKQKRACSKQFRCTCASCYLYMF